MDPRPLLLPRSNGGKDHLPQNQRVSVVDTSAIPGVQRLGSAVIGAKYGHTADWVVLV